MTDLSAFNTTAGPASKAREWPGDSPPRDRSTPNRMAQRVSLEAAMRHAGNAIRKTDRAYDVLGSFITGSPTPGAYTPAEAAARVTTLYHQMGSLAGDLDALALKVARLTLRLYDPSLEATDDQRDQAEERLERLVWEEGEKRRAFESCACEIDRLLDEMPYEASVAEVRSWSSTWGSSDPVLRHARGNVNVWCRAWWRVALGLALNAEGVMECPF